MGRVAFVMDRRLSRERRAHVTAALNLLRRVAFVDVWEIEDEAKAIEGLQADQYQMILAPWHLYTKWARIEGLFGLSRAGGPVFAGYIGEPVAPDALKEIPPFQRFMLFDFAHLQPPEIAQLITSLASDRSRTGIKPLLAAQAPIYTENWGPGTGLGGRLDGLTAISEITDLGWGGRLGGARSVLTALWSLVFEEGTQRACLQMGVDVQVLAFRLFFPSKGGHVKRFIEGFWPNREVSHAPVHGIAQTLLRHADFLRIQVVNETQDVEILAGLFKSGPSELVPGSCRTLWIEPIAAAARRRIAARVL